MKNHEREAAEADRAPLNHANAQSVDGMEFRRTRGPLDMSNKIKLDIPQRLLNAELSYRWVNDENGLVDQRRESGYETVPKLKGEMGEEISTRRRVGTNENGSPQYAVLMAIPKDWKQESENALEEERKALEQSIATGQSDGKDALGKDFYVKSNTRIGT